MPNQIGPWRKPENKGSRFHFGLYLWIGFLLAVGLTIWLLFVFFPEQAPSDEYTYFRIVNLVSILVLVSSGLIYARKIRLGEVVRNISIWTGLTAVLLIGYSYRNELTTLINRVGGELVPGHAASSTENELVITASNNGHFYVYGKANGKRVRFMVDTGASGIVLSPQAASRIGIDLTSLRFTQQFQTANGIGLGATYWLDSLSIGTLKFLDTRVSVNQSEMDTSLLGLAFLERLQSYEFRGDKLYFRR